MLQNSFHLHDSVAPILCLRSTQGALNDSDSRRQRTTAGLILLLILQIGLLSQLAAASLYSRQPVTPLAKTLKRHAMTC